MREREAYYDRMHQLQFKLKLFAVLIVRTRQSWNSSSRMNLGCLLVLQLAGGSTVPRGGGGPLQIATALKLG